MNKKVDADTQVAVARKLTFDQLPSREQVAEEIKEYVYSMRSRRRDKMRQHAVTYLRHRYTNWAVVHSELQEHQLKKWSVEKHHQVRDYVDELVWAHFSDYVPWEVG